jgi:retron-type reverse transcriptase
MLTKHTRITELAKKDKGEKFFSIAHLLTQDALYEAFESLRKDASVGVDGVTYAGYEVDAWENIRKLHDRLKNGQYRAQPLRRVYIPKEDGRQRPISIPSLEDKILQKATVDLLNAIYEQTSEVVRQFSWGEIQFSPLRRNQAARNSDSSVRG